MTGKSYFIYSEDYLKYQFGPTHPFQPVRGKMALDLLMKKGAFRDKARVVEPEPATVDDLLLVHSREYVEFVRRQTALGHGFLDFGDTPATKGLFEASCTVVGGSIMGAKQIFDGECTHAFNVGGGLHHAKSNAASGFCVFNDIAVAVKWLQKNRGAKRIAVIDIDGHHGDGTQSIFYNEPILKISFQRIGIFPQTGYVDEIGEGEGEGYSVNIPLGGSTGDERFLYAYREVVPPLLRWYKPEIVFFVCGIDGHQGDPLADLSLTSRTYVSVAESLHELTHELCQGKLLLLGGGGYLLDVTARCWALIFAVVSQTVSPSEYADLLDKEVAETHQNMSRIKDTVEEVRQTIFKMHNLL